MSYLGAQQLQPVPLFYGNVTTSPTVQPLQSGFDWVITTIEAVDGDIDQANLFTIKDENGVQIFAIPLNNSNLTGNGFCERQGFYPIGPRTALQLSCAQGQLSVYVGGYAVAPPTALHV